MPHHLQVEQVLCIERFALAQYEAPKGRSFQDIFLVEAKMRHTKTGFTGCS